MRGVMFCIAVIVFSGAGAQERQAGVVQLIFTSDAHYGITRAQFRGQMNVDGHTVNEAMIRAMNSLDSVLLPPDSGVMAGGPPGDVDYVIEGGDIANRMEGSVQTAAESWDAFYRDYGFEVALKGHDGKAAKLLMIAGNHDISNAIGFYKPMRKVSDASSLVNIYNLMLDPVVRKKNETYNYNVDKIHFSRNIGGIHFMFLQLWPDSAERIWMEQDLAVVSPVTPVVIFTHDQPESEAKHFTNPNPGHTINARDRFENLLPEVYKDGVTVEKDSTVMEQRGWVSFLKRHRNIKAYFHGNSNYNEFYTYKGPDDDIALPVFRVDSPMKGKYSSSDETRLSFQVITIDTGAGCMTVRECLWNTDPLRPEPVVRWGDSKTVCF